MNALASPVLELPSVRVPSLSSQRILVVDDDVFLTRLEAQILKSVGYRVDTEVEGESAFQALMSSPYDALVTDYLMPGLSGLALVRQMRVAHIDVPVVMVSGSLESLDLETLKEDPWSRICAFVQKPFRPRELIAAVAGAFGFPEGTDYCGVPGGGR